MLKDVEAIYNLKFMHLIYIKELLIRNDIVITINANITI